MTVRRPPPRPGRAPDTSATSQPQHLDPADLAGAALLGAALSRPEALIRLRALGLHRGELRGAQQSVWCALDRLAPAVVDVVTVAAALGPETLAAVGGVDYLTALVAQASPPDALDAHLDALHSAVHQREVGAALQRLTRSHGESPAAFEGALGDLSVLVAGSARAPGTTTLGALAQTVVKQIHDPQPTATLIPTGLPALDALVTVLPGHLVVLAGRPAMGKSLTGQWIAQQAARAAIPGLIVTLEMSAVELGVRALAAEARCDVTGVMRAAHGAPHGLGERALQRLQGAATQLGALPVEIDDQAQTLEHIERVIAQAAAAGVRLVVVDHLHCILADDGRNTETVLLGRITARLKAAARRHGVAIWLLAQLSRAVEYRPDHRPVLSDLRQSGEIEAYADTVVMAYRDEYYHPHSADAGILELIVSKQRHGTVGTVRVGFDGARQRLIAL